MPEPYELEWGDLRFFLAVARARTVTAAAKLLRVDHATVSRRIARLERQSHTILFLKRQSGYELTDAGWRLLEASEAVESAVMAGENILAGQDDAIRGVVRIGAPDGFGSFYLASILGELSERHPGLELQLVATARLLSLSQREADLAISLALPSHGRIAGRKLLDYKLGLFAARSYLARSPPALSIADLPQHAFIAYIDELLFSNELDYGRQIHPGIKPRFRSGNLIAQLNAARAGLGIAVLPFFLASQAPELEPVLPGEVELERSFWLLAHENDRNLERNRAVADFISACVQRDRALFRRFEPRPVAVTADPTLPEGASTDG